MPLVHQRRLLTGKKYAIGPPNADYWLEEKYANGPPGADYWLEQKYANGPPNAD